MPGTPADEPNWVLIALERFEGPLISYVGRLLGDTERARDVVQDVFLSLCSQRRESVEHKLAGWLFRVSRNAAIDVRRRESKMEPIEAATLPQASSAHEPPALAMRREDTNLLALALAGLPPTQLEVLQLRFQHGLSYRELSDVTGHSVSHVGVLIHTGIKSLRKKLGNRFELEVPR